MKYVRDGTTDAVPAAYGSAGEYVPLPPADHELLLRALKHVHGDLRGLLGALPVDSQSASGLARAIELERTTCQRAISAANQPFSGLPLVGQLPGVTGLGSLVEAVERRWHTAAEVQQAGARLRASIQEYNDALKRVAGTRARLLAKLANARQAESAAQQPPALLPRQLFDAAAGLTGRHSQTWLAVHIYEPTQRPDRLRQTRAHGLIQHVAREDAVPLTFHVFATMKSGDPQNDAEELGRFFPISSNRSVEGAPPELLTDFSTKPPPIVRARQPNEFLVQTVESDSPAGGACDLVFGLQGLMAHPRGAPPFLEEVWALVNFPARWLLLDVFLHRDLARTSIPGLDVHLWRPDFAAHAGERWQTRFPVAPRLEVLGAGLSQVETSAYARHRELVAHLFASSGLNPSDYIGYRCQTEYPLWRTGYRMTFDFGGPA